MKRFEMRHKIFGGKPAEFTESDAPDWLSCANTVKGSTADNRWFWTTHVLTLTVNQVVETEFHFIRRVE